MENNILEISAETISSAKRKASIILNKNHSSTIEYFIWRNLKFYRINKICPNNTIKFGNWK